MLPVGKTRHYHVLRSYFEKVIEDLTARGVIRRRYGQRFEDILREESQTLAQAIAGDVRAILLEMGISFVSSGASALESLAQEQVPPSLRPIVSGAFQTGKSALLELLASTASRKKR